jgi:hypothetical protein
LLSAASRRNTYNLAGDFKYSYINAIEDKGLIPKEFSETSGNIVMELALIS